MKYIKTDGINGYLYDNKTKEKKLNTKFDPETMSLYFVTKMGHGLVSVYLDGKAIRESYGSLIFNFNNEEFTLDDGFRDKSIKYGYIVLNDYSDFNCCVKQSTPKDQDNLFTDLKRSVENLGYKLEELEENEEYQVIINSDTYRYTFNFSSIKRLVEKNKSRKDLNLTYLPYDDRYDRYGSVYMSIYAKRTEDTTLQKYTDINKVVNKIIEGMCNDENIYSFHSIRNNKTTINCSI
jgi:hypothetical protein